MDKSEQEKAAQLEVLSRILTSMTASLREWFETQTFGDAQMSGQVCFRLAVAIATGEIKHAGLR